MEFDFAKEPGRQRLGRELNTDGKPLISVITPYYNAGTYFEQTFNCVMNQTFPWFEWIIVDDGSTDPHSVEELKRIAALDSRIQVYHQKNQGQSAARNAAAGHSTTEILLPLDADDLISPTFFETLYWALHFNPEAGWAYTDSCGFGAQEYLWKQPFSSTRMKHENLLVCTAAIRKKVFDSVGGYAAQEKHYDEDWHFWLRLLAEEQYPVHVRGWHFWYRRSASGMQQTVEHNQELRKKSAQLIREAAENIQKEVLPVEYPRSSGIEQYLPPVCSSWDRKVFKNHDKIHVMMLLPWMVMGGADLFNLDVCRMIDKDRFEISILTTQQSDNSWQQRFEEHVTDVFNLPNFMDIENWPEFISYFIKSREIDVLFLTNSYYGYYLVPWLRKEFPDLAIIDYVHMEEWYWRNGGFARTSGVMGGILEGTYVCNERTRRVMINDFNRAPESVETLYIGVDQDKFDANKVESGIVRKELGIAEDRPIILFPCRIHPQKRPFLMVEIAKELKKTRPEAAFVVVGDGPQLEELRIKVQQERLENTVYLAGRQSDMRPYYKDSALTRICSLKEALALTAYESFSIRTPVVTSDVGGQAELVNHETGRVLPLLQSEAEALDNRTFSAEEIKLYVDAIESLLGDRSAYAAACAACRARIETGFSTKIMIGKLEHILSTLVCDKVAKENRNRKAHALRELGGLADDYCTAFCEITSYDSGFKARYDGDMKHELMRIANSKWGRKLIKLAWKLKLNKLFR